MRWTDEMMLMLSVLSMTFDSSKSRSTYYRHKITIKNIEHIFFIFCCPEKKYLQPHTNQDSDLGCFEKCNTILLGFVRTGEKPMGDSTLSWISAFQNRKRTIQPTFEPQLQMCVIFHFGSHNRRIVSLDKISDLCAIVRFD